MNVEVASTWYQRGEGQLKAGNIQEAIASFRNAATNDHDNAQYTLALATALAAADHLEEARQGLLQLRTAEPESGEVNLNLARLSAKEGQMSEAVRYYHNALYGVWPPDRTATQRTGVRTELVRVLLEAGDTSQALSELLIQSSDTPDREGPHNEVGQLFLEAGDSKHALEHFSAALRLNERDSDALRGAGQAAFNLGDYSKARRYLDAAVMNGDKSAKTTDLFDTVKLVLSRDPLAPGLPTGERIRRLAVDLNFASQELFSCAAKTQDDQKSLVILQPLEVELNQGMQTQYRSQDLRRDADGFRTGLDLIHRIASATEETCGESSPFHTALLLIGRKHGVTEQ